MGSPWAPVPWGKKQPALSMGSSMGCSLCICSTMVSYSSYRGTSALVPAAHFPLVLLSGWCLVGLFLTLFHGCQAAFCFIFLPLRHCHLGCVSQPCPVVGPQELVGARWGQHGAASTSPPRAAPQHLGTCTHTLEFQMFWSLSIFTQQL